MSIHVILSQVYTLFYSSNRYAMARGVRNRSVMAAIDSECARISWLHWYAYALVKGPASYQNVFTPLPFFPSSLSSLSLFLSLHQPFSRHSFHQLELITINHGFHLNFNTNLSNPTLVSKTLIFDHYFSASNILNKLNISST